MPIQPGHFITEERGIPPCSKNLIAAKKKDIQRNKNKMLKQVCVLKFKVGLRKAANGN